MLCCTIIVPIMQNASINEKMNYFGFSHFLNEIRKRKYLNVCHYYMCILALSWYVAEDININRKYVC